MDPSLTIPPIITDFSVTTTDIIQIIALIIIASVFQWLFQVLAGKIKPFNYRLAEIMSHLMPLFRALIWLTAIILSINLILTISTLGLFILSVIILGLLTVTTYNVLHNIVSGIILRLTGVLKKGEFIEVQTNKGVVVTIGLLFIELQSAEQNISYIPNSLLIQSELYRASTDDYHHFVSLSIRVPGQKNIDHLQTLIYESVLQSSFCAYDIKPVVNLSGKKDGVTPEYEFTVKAATFNPVYMEEFKSDIQKLVISKIEDL